MRPDEKRERFERSILPHLDAAYNLARWLTGSAPNAEDAVQDSCVRALKFFDSFRGDDGRAWLLAIVRNTCYDWLRRNRAPLEIVAADEQMDAVPDGAPTAEADLLRRADRRLIHEALAGLPAEFREALVLRELECLSYKQIAQVTAMPIGTVMSRLARGRKRLEIALTGAMRNEAVRNETTPKEAE